MKKIVFTFLLVVFMSMTCYQSFAYDIAVQNSDGITIYYNYIKNNGRTELEVTYSNSNLAGIYSGYTGNVVIPESVNYGNTYSVTSIGKSAFYESNLTSVTIPNSVTSIGDCAFIGCRSLNTATIPNGVISIGDHAFSSCTSLTSVTIPRSVVSIGSDVFESGTLSSIIVEEGNSVYDSRNSCNAIIETSGNALIIGCKNTIIPNSVTSIGQSAFQGCYELSFVTIPNSVTSIGNYAFYRCSGLTSIVIGSGVTSIGNCAFANNEGLTYVTVYSSPSTIGEDLFVNSTNIKEVIFDCEIVTSLFQGVTTIENVTIKDGVKEIGISAFSGLTNITSIFLPNSITSIGGSAFGGCTGLNSIDLPNSLISIGDYAFYGCSGLNSLVIPNSVSTIGASAFANCNNLFSVTIGSGVTSIGDRAFIYNPPYYVSSVQYIVKKAIWLTNTPPNGYKNVGASINYVSNDQYSSLSNTKEYQFLSSKFIVDGIVYVPVSPSERICDAIDCVYNESENINIGETVTNKGITLIVNNVNPYTCYKNKHIKNVVLSSGGDIGDYAFEGCLALNTATINNKGNVGSYAFKDCTSLSTADINNIGNIGSNVFWNCTSLISAKIKNQGSIGYQAFYNCYSMETAELGEEVTSIGSKTFRNCSKLQSIVVPNAVTTMGSYAFSDCTGLTSAKIGNGLGVINEYTFSNCSSLKELTIGSQVTTINRYAFNNCSSLPTITIPQAVTKIGNSVFYGCLGLKEVIMSDSKKDLVLESNAKNNNNYGNPLFSDCPLDSVYIGRDISYNTSSDYGYSPFYRNTSLRAVKITDKETEISANEFYGCTNLHRVIIGDGVTTIGDWAFSGCFSLKYFAFGSQMQTIGKEAFSDCTAVVEISSKAETPPICNSQALDDINKWECKLYVPEGGMAAYQAADQWKDFFFTEEGKGTAGQNLDDPNIDNPEGKKCESPTISIVGDKIKFSCKTEGVLYHYSITSLDIKDGVINDDEVDVKKTYRVSVYASKDGYYDSDTTTKEIKMTSGGDVNEDGVVDAADVVKIVNIIMGK